MNKLIINISEKFEIDAISELLIRYGGQITLISHERIKSE